MAMKILTPLEPVTEVDLFLAGGISNCPDWQASMLLKLEEILPERTKPWLVANPRRSEGFESTGPAAAAQIAWEYEALKVARLVSFWFPKETLCPITLFELGVQLGRAQAYVIVGAEATYQRRFDLQEQLALAMATNEKVNAHVVGSLEELAAEASLLLSQ